METSQKLDRKHPLVVALSKAYLLIEKKVDCPFGFHIDHGTVLCKRSVMEEIEAAIKPIIENGN